MSSTVTLGPAEAIRVLSAELHDALRQLLDTTDRGDPELLDKMRRLSTGLGKRLTNARKRAVAEQGRTEPAEPKPVVPAKTEPTPRATSSTTKAPDVEPKRTLPTRVPTPRSTTVTIPRTKPAHAKPADQPRPTRPKPSAPGRDRAPQRTTPPTAPASTPTLDPSRPTLPRWLWPTLLLLAVFAVLVAPAWTGWAVSAVGGAAAWLTRSSWAGLLPNRFTIKSPGGTR